MRRNESVRHHGGDLTFPALCTQKVADIIVNPEVLLQHVLPCEGFVTLITAVALHPWMVKQTLS